MEIPGLPGTETVPMALRPLLASQTRMGYTPG